MKCKQCKQEYEAKRSTSKYCSPKCRKLAFLLDGKVSVPSPKDDSKFEIKGTAELASRIDRRTNPDVLNYGKHMNSHELEQAGLKANRVPIPGDSDYKGCCELIDGQWQARQVA